jgi:hypothetical protein
MIKTVALFLALMFALTQSQQASAENASAENVSPENASAQDSTSDWNRVRAIKLGTELIVETRNGESVKGKLTGATDAGLQLSRGDRNIALDQVAISKVYLTKKGSRIKAALLGGLKGAGIGLAIGAAIALADSQSGDPNFAPASGVLFGFPAGVVYGAVRGGKSRKGRLVYDGK